MCARHMQNAAVQRPPDCHCHTLKLVSMSLHLFLIVTSVSPERLDT
jgi:hypothetical protein